MTKAEATKAYILEKSFELIYQNGYQATSIDKIIETTQVTKGAFYYHYKNKEEMGVAIIKEIISPRIKKGLVDPLDNYEHPVEGIYETIQKFLMGITDHQIQFGCPMNNLIQEMAPLHPGFQLALGGILKMWEEKLVEVLMKAKEMGVIQQEHLQPVARFIISGYEGTRGLGKIYQTQAYYEAYLSQLKVYLNAL